MQNKITFAASVTVLILGGGALIYLFFGYLAGVLFPFVLGWVLAMLVRRPAGWLHEKTGLPLGGSRLLLLALSVLLLGALLFFALRGAFRELSHFLSEAGGGGADLIARVRAFLVTLPLVGEALASSGGVEEALSLLLSALPTVVASLADVLPRFFFTFGVSVIAAVYFCLDLDRIHAALSRRMPSGLARVLRFFKDSAVRAAFSVLRAQGTLMMIAFSLLLIGFLLLNVKYPLLLSGVFAFLDFLPVLGVGLFLLPWGVFSLLTGKHALGIGLLVLYLVIAAVRQFLEPRLLGRGYGVHPLLTLLSLYAGARLFGFVGLLLVPAFTLLLHGILFPPAEKNEK